MKSREKDQKVIANDNTDGTRQQPKVLQGLLAENKGKFSLDADGQTVFHTIFALTFTHA